MFQNIENQFNIDIIGDELIFSFLQQSLLIL